MAVSESDDRDFPDGVDGDRPRLRLAMIEKSDEIFLFTLNVYILFYTVQFYQWLVRQLSLLAQFGRVCWVSARLECAPVLIPSSTRSRDPAPTRQTCTTH